MLVTLTFTSPFYFPFFSLGPHWLPRASMRPSYPRAFWPAGGGLGIAAMTYIGVDYIRHISPAWHARLQPVLWALLALIAIIRIPYYKHWSVEMRSAVVFIASMIFMVGSLLVEMITVRSVTAVLGLDWHRYSIRRTVFSVRTSKIIVMLLYYFV